MENIISETYKTAQMGMIGISLVVTKVNNKKFIKLLKSQEEEYKLILEDLVSYSKTNNISIKKVNMLEKIMAKIMTNLNYSDTQLPTVIAKEMIKGTNMGIINVIDILNNKTITDRKLKKIVKNLHETLENNHNDLKKWI